MTRNIIQLEGPDTDILDEKNYYPFGGEHKGYNMAVNGNYHPYGFGGKVENDELGLQWMDFGARNYDKWLGRWMNIDPLVEYPKQISMSPYVQYFGKKGFNSLKISKIVENKMLKN